MTNRVLLGNKSGAYNLFVSKAAVDVVTATDDGDMLFSPTMSPVQIVARGSFADPGANHSTDVTIPDLGYTPVVLLWSEKYACGYSMPNSTTIRIHTFGADVALNSIFSGLNGRVRYVVTNLEQLL